MIQVLGAVDSTQSGWFIIADRIGFKSFSVEHVTRTTILRRPVVVGAASSGSADSAAILRGGL